MLTYGKNLFVLCVAQSVLRVHSLIDSLPQAPFSLPFSAFSVSVSFSFISPFTYLTLFPILFLLYSFHSLPPLFLCPSLLPSTSLISSFLLPNSKGLGGEVFRSPWQQQVPFFRHASQSWLEFWVGPGFSELMRTGCALLPHTTTFLRKCQPMGTQKLTTCLSNKIQQ